ncbi:Ycf3-interacting protein 1, chloroplastic [Linum grandiflorum]
MASTLSFHLTKFPTSSSLPVQSPHRKPHFVFLPRYAGLVRRLGVSSTDCAARSRRRNAAGLLLVGRDDAELQVQQGEEELPPSPQDLANIEEIKRVLQLLKKNRDMDFYEVKLTISIEDPREVERRKLFGIEDPDAPTREDLAEALELVKEGKIPENRAALQMLADEMTNWPNLEVEAFTKKKPTKSLYARITDTGVDLREAAKRLKFDWDSEDQD